MAHGRGCGRSSFLVKKKKLGRMSSPFLRVRKKTFRSAERSSDDRVAEPDKKNSDPDPAK